MTSHLPVVRHSRGDYVVNPDYADLAERQHELLEMLSRRGMRFLPRQAPLSVRSVVEWPTSSGQEGMSAAAGTPDAAVRIANLRQSVSSRALIGQAQGILMERHALSTEQAFARLREMSHTSQQRIHAVARQVVETGPDYSELMAEDLDGGGDRCYG